MAAAEVTPQVELLEKLEEFFSGPKFTTALGSFMGEHANDLEYKPLDEDQPLKNHDAYQKYCAMIEGLLEDFLKEVGATVAEIMGAVKYAHEQSDLAHIACIDYLNATTEYESFMELAYDHAGIVTWEPVEGEEWDAPVEDDDERLPLDADMSVENDSGTA